MIDLFSKTYDFIKKDKFTYKSGHIYLEILVGLVWPRVFVCPPPPSKLGAQPFPIFFHPPFLSSPLQLWRGARGATTKKHNTATFKKNVTRVVGGFCRSVVYLQSVMQMLAFLV